VEPETGRYAAIMRHDTLRMLERLFCLSLQLKQLVEINLSYGPDS
jgi:hypothetical protein